jgi:uncharacterized protein (TIGR02301 family)
MALNPLMRGLWPAAIIAGLLIASGLADCGAQAAWLDFLRGKPNSPPAPELPAPTKPPVPKKQRPKAPIAKVEPPKPGSVPSPIEEPPPPYEPQLLRLAEILGALTYLKDICGAPDADQWRTRMQALLDAEPKTQLRKDHLAGAYNRGFNGYELTYNTCTDSARLIIQRFMTEGEKITHDVANRFSAN